MAKSDDIQVAWIVTALNRWEATGRLAGAADLPWCPEGQRAALDAAATLREGELNLVFHAPDESSEQTAQAFAATTGAKLKAVEELSEVGLGLWEGMLAKDAEEKFASSYRQWVEDPSSVTPPGGESLAEAEERLIGALARHLSKTKPGAVLGVVLHPLAMGIVRCWRRALPLSGAAGVAQGCTGVEWDTISRESLRREATG